MIDMLHGSVLDALLGHDFGNMHLLLDSLWNWNVAHMLNLAVTNTFLWNDFGDVQPLQQFEEQEYG